MRKPLFLLIATLILSQVSLYSTSLDEYYRYGEFKRYVRSALNKKDASLYGKIGKSYFFIGNYKRAEKYLKLAYDKTGEVDLLNFYAKCETELEDGIIITKRIKNYIKSNNYDTLALGLFYAIHDNDSYLNLYTDSIHSKFPSSELSFIAEKRLLYNSLISSETQNRRESVLKNFLQRYRDTYIYNEALIIETKYRFKNKNRKGLLSILNNTLASTETKSIVIEKLLDLGYHGRKLEQITLLALKDSSIKPNFVKINEWEFKKRRTAILLRLDLARYLIRDRKPKEAISYLKSAESYALSIAPEMIYKQSILYYKSVAYLKRGEYESAKRTIVKGLITGGGKEKELLRLYGRNFPGNPLTYARKIEKYRGPIFRNTTRLRGLEGTRGYRIAAADINNDGYPDLLIDGRLFLNKRGLKFVDITEKAGLSTDYSDRFFFTDFNNDGKEDVLLANRETGISIYKNIGNGTFRIAWRDTSLYNYTMVIPFNYRNHSLPDILIASSNAKGELILLVNKDSFNFKRETFPFPGTKKIRGVSVFNNSVYLSFFNLSKNRLILLEKNTFNDYANDLHVAGINNNGWWGNSLGAYAGDINNDGKIDLVVCNTTTPANSANSDISEIYIRHDGIYKDIFTSSGVRYDMNNINPILSDFNNDGYNDLFITSREESHLYLNTDNGLFKDITFLSGARLNDNYGVISTDFDRDGDQDLFVCSPEGITLLENIRKNKNTYFNIEIQGKKSGSDAFGAKVTLFFNNFKITRFIHTIDGIGNQDDRMLHFGLNIDYGPIRKVKIVFPSGKTIYLYNVKRGGVLKINE